MGNTLQKRLLDTSKTSSAETRSDLEPRTFPHNHLDILRHKAKSTLTVRPSVCVQVCLSPITISSLSAIRSSKHLLTPQWNLLVLDWRGNSVPRSRRLGRPLTGNHGPSSRLIQPENMRILKSWNIVEVKHIITISIRLWFIISEKNMSFGSTSARTPLKFYLKFIH